MPIYKNGDKVWFFIEDVGVMTGTISHPFVGDNTWYVVRLADEEQSQHTIKEDNIYCTFGDAVLSFREQCHKITEAANEDCRGHRKIVAARAAAGIIGEFKRD